MFLAYLDCFSGISGNMLLGALLDCGLPATFLKDTVASLDLPGIELAISRTCRNHLGCHLVMVRRPPEQHSRHLADIEAILTSAPLDPAVRDRALAVFTRLAAAEARVHNTRPQDIHFHEVGAADALVDIVGVVAGLAHLQVAKLICSPLPLSTGWTNCAHGELPLPAPAVLELLQDVPVRGVTLEQELVTPTGAALVRELADDFGSLPAMVLERVGYGAGTRQRQDGRPNLLRLILGRNRPVAEACEVEVIETHLDDWNPELWPHVCSLLMEAGALDASLTPMQMKKGRPGFLVRVISDPAHGLHLKEIILRETSAIGLRFRTEHRLTLPRQSVQVATPWGPIQAKAIQTGNNRMVLRPEYEVCRRLARRHRIPLQEIYRVIGGATTFPEDSG